MGISYHLHFKYLYTKIATKVNSGKTAQMNAVNVCTKNNVITYTAHVQKDVPMGIEALSVKPVSKSTRYNVN